MFSYIKVKMQSFRQKSHKSFEPAKHLILPFLRSAPLSPHIAREKGKEEEITIMKRNYKLLRGPNTHVVHYIEPNFLFATVSGCSYILH